MVVWFSSSLHERIRLFVSVAAVWQPKLYKPSTNSDRNTQTHFCFLKCCEWSLFSSWCSKVKQLHLFGFTELSWRRHSSVKWIVCFGPSRGNSLRLGAALPKPASTFTALPAAAAGDGIKTSTRRRSRLLSLKPQTNVTQSRNKNRVHFTILTQRLRPDLNNHFCSDWFKNRSDSYHDEAARSGSRRIISAAPIRRSLLF